MVKGTQRQMIMVRTPESELFELAYFVLRTDVRGGTDEGSMIDEANMIVQNAFGEGLGSKGKRKNKKVRGRAGRAGAVLFFAGSLFLFFAFSLALILFGSL